MTLKVLIVDDEALARSRLRTLLGECSEPRADVVVGTAMTVSFALSISEAAGIPAWVAKLAPDIPSAAFVTPGSAVSRVGWVNFARSMGYWLNVASAANGVGLTRVEDEWRQGSLGLRALVPRERMDDMTFSALASVSEPISPTMDTMAVCGMVGLLVGAL